MSIFLERVRKLSSNFKLNGTDQAKLLAHYPLFKMAWHASYGSSWKKRAAEKIMPVFSDYSTSFKAKGKDNVTVPVPVSFRLSDMAIFEEIFFENEYAPPTPLKECKTYVDLGGNVGIAAIYFLLKCNLEHLILVEANPSLIPLLKNNLASPAKNKKIQIEHGYISGSSREPIDFLASDNHGLSTSAALASTQSGKVVSLKQIPLRDLLDRENLEEVDILKMDIEGGEYNLMSEDPQIFKRFKNLFIEIHGAAAKREAFVQQICDLGFKIVHGKKADTGFDTIYARRKV